MKSIFASKVFWANALAIILAIAAIFGITPDPVMTQKVAAIVIMAMPFVNIILRFFTSKEIAPLF